MKLFLLRHGDASFAAHNDCERPLTEYGRGQIHQVVTRVTGKLSSTPVVLTSPKLRARQTAEVAQSILLANDASVSEHLKPCGELVELGKLIDHHGDNDLLLVTHQPLVGDLLDYLIDMPGTGRLMGVGCFAALDLITFGRGCGTLEWLEAPN